MSALPAFAILAGFDEQFQKRHWLGRAMVPVPDLWVDLIMPGVRGVLQELDRRVAEPGGPSNASARSTLRALLRLGTFWWQVGLIAVFVPCARVFDCARCTVACSCEALRLCVWRLPH